MASHAIAAAVNAKEYRNGWVINTTEGGMSVKEGTLVPPGGGGKLTPDACRSIYFISLPGKRQS